MTFKPGRRWPRESLLTLLLCLGLTGPVEAASVSALQGFQHIAWGTPRSAVLAALARRYQLKASDSNGDPVFYGSFGGYRNAYVFPRFLNNRLTEVYIGLSSQDDKTSLDIFNDVLANLRKTYGAFTAASVHAEAGGSTDVTSLLTQGALSSTLTDDVLAARAGLGARWEFNDGSELLLVVEPADLPETSVVVILSYMSPTASHAPTPEILNDLKPNP